MLVSTLRHFVNVNCVKLLTIYKSRDAAKIKIATLKRKQCLATCNAPLKLKLPVCGKTNRFRLIIHQIGLKLLCPRNV